MFSAAAILGWLGSKGVSLLLGYLFGFLLDVVKTTQNNQAHRDLGRTEVERDQAREGEIIAGKIADEASKNVTEDDAISRLDGGKA